MQNQLVKWQGPKPPLPYVIGGNSNGTLKAWFSHLGVPDYVHVKLDVGSIAPEDIQRSAETLKSRWKNVEFVFSVGLFADKLLRAAGLDHGALPLTNTEDKKLIESSLLECRNYLLRRIYGPQSTPPTICS